MAKKKVVTRSSRTAIAVPADFNFTRQMVPALAGDGYPDFLRSYRSKAWQVFEDLPIPTTSDEAWRRTDIRSLAAGDFRIPGAQDSASLPEAPAELLHPVTDEEYGWQGLLMPAGVSVMLNPELAAKGVIFTDLATAERQHPQILEKILGKVVRPDEGKFAALAGALAQTGVLLYVPPGLQLEQPLQSILWGPGSGLAYISQIMVWVDDGASLTYVHEAASHTETGGQTLHAGLVEVHVGAGAANGLPAVARERPRSRSADPLQHAGGRIQAHDLGVVPGRQDQASLRIERDVRGMVQTDLVGGTLGSVPELAGPDHRLHDTVPDGADAMVVPVQNVDLAVRGDGLLRDKDHAAEQVHVAVGRRQLRDRLLRRFVAKTD